MFDSDWINCTAVVNRVPVVRQLDGTQGVEHRGRQGLTNADGNDGWWVINGCLMVGTGRGHEVVQEAIPRDQRVLGPTKAGERTCAFVPGRNVVLVTPGPTKPRAYLLARANVSRESREVPPHMPRTTAPEGKAWGGLCEAHRGTLTMHSLLCRGMPTPLPMS